MRKKGKSDFRWMIGVLDIKSNKLIFHQKNMDFDNFDRVVNELKFKLRYGGVDGFLE